MIELFNDSKYISDAFIRRICSKPRKRGSNKPRKGKKK